MSFAILGMGTAVPPHRYAQAESAAIAGAAVGADADQSAILTELYVQTEIASRHTVIPKDVADDLVHGTDAAGSPFSKRGADGCGPDTAERMAVYVRDVLPLARQAARRAREESGVAPAAITHLVTVSCTGFAAPGFDIGLMKSLELGPTVERTHLGFMGCHGAFNGLRVARALAESNPNACVLLCAAELSSIHYHYTWNPKRLVGNALFADGAAAVVGASGDAAGWRVAANGSCLFANSEHAMTWTIGNHGFDMTLSAKVPNLIAEHLRPWLETWLRAEGLSIRDVGSWAIHPGGPRILTAVESALGLDRAQTWASREVLSRFGNMSSPTVLFILQRLHAVNARRPCVAVGFGPGLAAEAALIH
jgi:predicted naringenin-chalcone synthase